VHRPERLLDVLQRDLTHGGCESFYLTAPKVRPRTSCR
jgi:hypothetical protein